MKIQYAAILAIATLVGTGCTPATDTQAPTEQVNPCAADPCAANPCAADPCAADPCAADPCAGT